MLNGKILQVTKYFLPEGLDCCNTVKAIIEDINSDMSIRLKPTVDLILEEGELISGHCLIDYKVAQTFLMQYSRMINISCDNCKHKGTLPRDSTVDNFYFCKLEDEESVKKLSLNTDVFETDKVISCKKTNQCEDFENRELPEDALLISEIVEQLL